MTCLYPRCGASPHGRGLCVNHYNLALQLVRSGRTSWRELERSGKSQPVGKRRGDFTAWLLSSNNDKGGES